MITPASVADWAMFAGVLGMLTGVAALGHRAISDEVTHPEHAPADAATASPPADLRAA